MGLDGCFLSGPYPGQILTAVGVDPNNGIYPLAYAVVESETKESWLWFLDCLGDDLELFRNSNFTFISDRQKNNTKTSYGDVQQLQQFRGLERIWKKPPVGRPRKKRRKGAAEIYDNLVKKGKLSRAGKTVTCLKCGQQGHNKRSCKGQRQKGSASGSHALPQAPSQTTTHASAQAPQSSTQPSQALQSSTQPSQASNRFTKSTANRLSPLKKKFVGPRPAAT
ncbi:mutator type transposase, partial [Tanacetum coccineum]